MQTQRVKASHFTLRHTAFQIFHAACEARLTVSFKNRNIDQKITFKSCFADLKINIIML